MTISPKALQRRASKIILKTWHIEPHGWHGLNRVRRKYEPTAWIVILRGGEGDFLAVIESGADGRRQRQFKTLIGAIGWVEEELCGITSTTSS